MPCTQSGGSLTSALFHSLLYPSPRNSAKGSPANHINSLRIRRRRPEPSGISVHTGPHTPRIPISSAVAASRRRVALVPIPITGVIIEKGGARIALVEGGGAESAAERCGLAGIARREDPG